MEDFCNGEPFWDVNLTWNGDWPQFTECFQDTALVWTTCGYLWFVTLFYVFYLGSRPDIPAPVTKLFTAKLFACGALFILRLVQLLRTFESSETASTAELTSYALHLATLLLAASLIILERKKGLVTSPVLFGFWIISVLANIIPFYSKIKLQENVDNIFNFMLFYVIYGCTLVALIIFCFAEDIPPGTFNTNGNPEVKASTLSRITFWWINRLVIQGYKGLKEKDLIPLNPRDTTAENVPIFQSHLRKELEKNKAGLKETLENSWYTTSKKYTGVKYKKLPDEKSPLLAEHNGVAFEKSDAHKAGAGDKASNKDTQRKGKASILTVVLKTFWVQILCCQSVMVPYTAAVLLNPLILREMINFTSNLEEATWKGYVYACGMFAMSTLQSVCMQVCMFYTTTLSTRISASLTSAVYRKALTMNSEARRESTVGEIVNLMSVDSRNVEMYVTYSFWMWMSPVQMVIAVYLLYTVVGVSMFAGLAFMVLLFTVNTYLLNKMRIYQKAAMTIRDKRVKVLNEVLNGIKILKLYAWEPSFQERVTDIRDQELKQLLKSSLVDSFLSFAWTAAVYWMTLFTYMTFVLVDDSHYLDASTSFVALSYFNVIRLALNVMPAMIKEGIKCIVSLGRINNYINSEDLDTSNVSRETRDEYAVKVEDGIFAWSRKDAPTLKQINVKVKRGGLVAVVGQVGAGKSSLISAMLGEMETLQGHVNISGSVAYVPQQAWIQNETLRSNILFGADMDERKYQNVLDACALKPDLEILAAGDLTEIGEKGINLSGGQKQRVSVARAVYSDADVVLLDDPLSAVDSHVGKHIFSKVIGHGGLLDGKTRILVTHGLQWLPKVDSILVMTDGRISEMGTYNELLSHNGAFAQFLTTYLTQQDESEDDEDDEEAQTVRRQILQRLVSVHSDSEASGDEKSKDQLLERFRRESESSQKKDRRKKHDSLSSAFSASYQRQTSEKKALKEKEEEAPDKSRLVTEEEVESGRVNWGVYIDLARAMGLKYASIMLLFFTIYNAASLGSNLWLSEWTDDTELANASLPADSDRRRQLNDFYLGLYAGLGIAQTVFVIVYAVIMAFRRIHAARTLHRSMLVRLLRAPMSFFDTTPVGRILNRFSQDMDMVDGELCVFIEIWVDSLEKVLSTVIAISYTTPIFLAVFAPAFVIYYFILRFYIGTSCQLRRLQSKLRSPIYNHFSETLSGAHVIRAYGAQQRFAADSEHKVDACQTCNYNSNGANRWLGVRLDFIGSILILAAATFTVISRNTLSAGIVGLSLSYAMEVTGKLNLLVRISTEVETNIVAVERIGQYTKVPNEAPWSVVPRPRPDWPQYGNVRYNNYSTRYRPGLDLVLRDLNCEIRSGEKIGIVGRTGAGKSSMTLSLFRLVEAAGGQILVDDVDIGTIGLHELRQKITILPQDPVLFDGTLRMNLDPFDMYTDEQIWKVLEQAHLKNFVQDLSDGLGHLCGEGGASLSVGQRQLLCLARTLLRKTKILVLDEATAAVDMETDDLIQQTIRREFAECTILTIAHRLNTVMDYDRIMVMDGGRVCEFDSPSHLLEDTSSMFYSMAKDAGLV
ncbi:multidrug resistance-associated protein 1-like [Pomacea canaliculata]|uniref:multidrug resistance-associated protein 1-like n=1 Tax=Pomacea canaliculata TaxID=400727 RepID=UPI000D736346|nr:multidrug resistance-associated protein 1-like [Pomacea canaliculata]XP_025097265.1 multidrug resistance-associated protein 1-like [Pomacea canaliculata]XP_025097266.1 multidrug resistance-associated protein 1-like [Pomacea canaliculata]